MSKANTTKRILSVFGTRPEVIKLAPVIQEREDRRDAFETVNVSSSQHTSLLYPLIDLFGLCIDHDLRVMRPKQTLNGLCARVLESLDPILERTRPDLILVQGDTTTAMAGALAGFHRKIPVAHVEAGLRTGNALSPFPEEMNRRIVSRLATYHFAPTRGNLDILLAEGVPPDRVFLTGNPVVDSLVTILEKFPQLPVVDELVRETEGLRRIVLTTHRRESFGETMVENLRVVRRFVESHSDVAVIFPVHPNPAVTEAARLVLADHPRIRLIPPLRYEEFVVLLAYAWLIVSDSGGVQEEAPTLGKPLLILRENTEVPEAVECGVAKLVGGCPDRLASALEQVHSDGTWIEQVRKTDNPFGQGDSGTRIADALEVVLGACSAKRRLQTRPPVSEIRQAPGRTDGAPRIPAAQPRTWNPRLPAALGGD
jgi:UDP-N-acetylglucosamine 2-epimerase (non-hydrolysing)